MPDIGRVNISAFTKKKEAERVAENYGKNQLGAPVAYVEALWLNLEKGLLD